jgi:hypothetical protein
LLGRSERTSYSHVVIAGRVSADGVACTVPAVPESTTTKAGPCLGLHRNDFLAAMKEGAEAMDSEKNPDGSNVHYIKRAKRLVSRTR